MLTLLVGLVSSAWATQLAEIKFVDGVVSHYYEYDSYEFGGEENLFVQLKAMGVEYDIEDFVKHNKVKGSDKERLIRLQEKVKKEKLKDFTLLYIGYGEIAHFTGKEAVYFKIK